MDQLENGLQALHIQRDIVMKKRITICYHNIGGAGKQSHERRRLLSELKKRSYDIYLFEELKGYVAEYHRDNAWSNVWDADFEVSTSSHGYKGKSKRGLGIFYKKSLAEKGITITMGEELTSEGHFIKKMGTEPAIEGKSVHVEMNGLSFTLIVVYHQHSETAKPRDCAVVCSDFIQRFKIKDHAYVFGDLNLSRDEKLSFDNRNNGLDPIFTPVKKYRNMFTQFSHPITSFSRGIKLENAITNASTIEIRPNGTGCIDYVLYTENSDRYLIVHPPRLPLEFDIKFVKQCHAVIVAEIGPNINNGHHVICDKIGCRLVNDTTQYDHHENLKYTFPSCQEYSIDPLVINKEPIRRPMKLIRSVSF